MGKTCGYARSYGHLNGGIGFYRPWMAMASWDGWGELLTKSRANAIAGRGQG